MTPVRGGPRSAPGSPVDALLRGAIVFHLVLLGAALWLDPRQARIIGWLERHLFTPAFWESYARVMERSLFDDGVPGGSDVGVLFVLACLLGWLALVLRAAIARARGSARGAGAYRRWRRLLGFVVLTGLVFGVLVVHGLKTLVGRARPARVFEAPELYSPWVGPGAEFLDGAGSSFPSGHTATVMLLSTVPYALRRTSPKAATLAFLGVLVFAYAMALGRCVAAHHWFSDTVASIVLCLVLLAPLERVALGRQGMR